MSEEGVPRAIVDAANAAYARGKPSDADRVIILLDAMHRDIHQIPERTATLLNGRNNRRLRDRAKSTAPPFIVGGGVFSLVFELMRVLV